MVTYLVLYIRLSLLSIFRALYSYTCEYFVFPVKFSSS